MSRRRQRLLLGCITALAGLYVDDHFVGSQLACSRMVLYTVFIFGLFGIQLGKTLRRPRQAAVALGLVILHFVLLVRSAGWFSTANTPVIIVAAVVESIVLVFLYARIGQEVDPSGTFGLTDAESEKKRVMAERLRRTL